MFKQIRWIIKKWTGSKSCQHYSPARSDGQIQRLDSTTVQRLARRYGGKLLLQEEITLSTDYFQRLVNLRYFTPKPSIHRYPFYNECTRCGNKQREFFAQIPCLRCHKTHLYCRKCIHMGRILACEPLYVWNGSEYNWPTHQNACTWKGHLTILQQQAANRIVETIRAEGRLIIWAVTGAGKTEMLFPGIAKALETGQRICIASPRADVVRELLPRLTAAFQPIHVQGLFSGSRDNDGTAQLIIATTHQLLRYNEAFDVLIVDEIDAFPYHQDTSLQFAANRAKKKTAALLYLTATPRAAQHRQIAARKMEHIFVPTRFHGHPLIIPKWIQVHQLKKHIQSNTMPIPMIQWLKKHKTRKRQLLIFVPTIQQTKEIANMVIPALLQEQCIATCDEVTCVHAEDHDRHDKVNAFRSKELTVLITTTILERGVTFPAIDVIVLDAGHHVFDEAALIQIAGRAGRSPIDPNGDVIFFHDGKTDAMVRANREIAAMNQRRYQLLKEAEK